MFEWLLPLAFTVFNYLFITVFLKYVVTKWIAGKIAEFVKYLLIRSQRNAVYWVHYRERAMKNGHRPRTPEQCTDGVCGSYHTFKIS
jgi:hypothetical protein